MSLLVIGLTSCDGIKSKLAGLMKNSLPEAKPVAVADKAPENTVVVATPSGESVRQLSGAEFEAFVATPNRVVMVDFYADWCGSCRQLGPVLDDLVIESSGKVLLGMVNVDQNRDLAGQKGVRNIPDVRFYKNGKEVDRFVGVVPTNIIRAMIDKHLVDLSVPPPAPPPPIEAPVHEVAKTPAPPVAAPDPAAPSPPAQPKPLTAPMSKDWMPPGIKRR